MTSVLFFTLNHKPVIRPCNLEIRGGQVTACNFPFLQLLDLAHSAEKQNEEEMCCMTT